MRSRTTPLSQPQASGPELRIQIHSHDSFGLGHLRRCMTIAEALRAGHPGAHVLITTGSPCATNFGIQDGIDIVKLPSVTKDHAGNYVPRSLGRDLDPVLRIRRGILSQVQRSFEPHVLIVDHQILGLAGELDHVLHEARKLGTRTILGVRDIIDTRDAVVRDWERPRACLALREQYDRLCVYGDPAVFDPREEYPIPSDISERLELIGYVARPAIPRAERGSRPPTVLVTVGGGEDGGVRIDTYLDALDLAPVEFDSNIVLGPLIDPDHARALKRRAKDSGRVHLQLFHADLPHLLANSDAVVGMAGYNTTVEVLQSRIPAVLCPRSFPRREQLLRAERLAELGLLDCLPNPTPQALRKTLEDLLRRGPSRAPLPRLSGCEQLVRIVGELAGIGAPLAQELGRS